jgi:glycosyltransferase involved in cell wall biosynthesis
LISVIIPSYNHSHYIRRSIESVISQSYQDWELIIIDDGSKDDSNQIISSYKDDRIVHLTQENQGAHNTINRGLCLAKGDFLAVLNSDDEFHPTRLERCLDVLHSDQEIMLVSTWIDIVDHDSRVISTKHAWRDMEPWPVANKHLSMAATDDYALNALMSNFVSTTSNMVFRRELYEAIGGMRNLRFAHDWDFLLRACAEHKCLNLDESLLSYRIHGTNTISSNRKAMLFEICWIFAANMDRFAERLLPDLSAGTIARNHLRLLESINFQGNDHIFWLLYWHIANLRRQGISNPEEIYLQDAELRASIIHYVKD